MSEKNNRRLAAIMFTDIVGYSAMMHANEREGRIKATRFRQVLQEYVDQHHGQIIQHYGDGSLSIFPSAVEAVDCAREVQIALREVPQVPLRAGIHIGDIVVDGQEIFGDGVNIASRVESMGVPGAVLVTERVSYDLKSHPEFEMKSVGFFKFKNIVEPMEVLALSNAGFPVPNPQDLKGKGKAVKGLSTKVLGLGLLVLLLGLLGTWGFMNKDRGKEKANTIQDARIAVPVFQNFTLIDSLEVLGKMAAHWITKGLSETGTGSIVDYESVASQPKIATATTENKNRFSLLTGAVNIIEGSYSIASQNQDSLVFTALIKDFKTGSILHSFSSEIASKSAPLKAIEQLSGKIEGYWASKETHITSIPDYDAYKAFIAAKEVWNKDQEEAEKQLLAAIGLDSSFYDSYLLLMPLYRNQKRFDEVREIIAKLRSKIQELNARQKNVLFLSEAILRGENKKAYEYYLQEYQLNPKDYFINTTAMVLGMEYVNAPEMVVKFFKELPIDELDLPNCAYCVESVYFAMLAHMKLGQFKKARRLAEKIPRNSPHRGYYLDRARIQAHFGDTAAINQIIQEAARADLKSDYRFIYYQVAEQFKLQGDKSLMEHYAQQIIARPFYKRTLARAHTLVENYDVALQLYEELLAENPEHIANNAQLGVILAKTGKIQEAKEVINQMEPLRKEYDYGIVSYEQAKIYLQIGDEEKALAKLEESVHQGVKFYYRRFENDPDLLPLLHHPEYQRIIHPLNESLN